jgi:hypothetical protein
MLVAKRSQPLAQELPAGFAEDIADEENPHCAS